MDIWWFMYAVTIMTVPLILRKFGLWTYNYGPIGLFVIVVMLVYCITIYWNMIIVFFTCLFCRDAGTGFLHSIKVSLFPAIIGPVLMIAGLPAPSIGGINFTDDIVDGFFLTLGSIFGYWIGLGFFSPC